MKTTLKWFVLLPRPSNKVLNPFPPVAKDWQQESLSAT